MRLRELKLRNIASLKGEHHVDFRDIESRSYLFAITGETGAGKSSLLNSIGLALYGQVFKKSVNQNDLVTLGEKDGEIQLLFEVKGRPYLASWRAKVLKSNGEPYATPQSPTRELYELESPGLDAQKAISSKKVEELLGLDYDQFCKCIILNQGEFARFLLSTFTERKEILEKLYPGEVLENVSRELKAELDALQEEKLQIDAALGTLGSDGNDVDSLEKERSTLALKLEGRNLASDQLKKLQNSFSSAVTYHRNHTDYALKKSQLQTEVDRETIEFNRVLKLNEEASLLLQRSREKMKTEEPRLLGLLEKELSLRHAEAELKKTQTELERILTNLETKKRSQQELSQSLEENKKKSTQIAEAIPLPLDSILTLKDHLPRILEIDRDRNHLKTQGEIREGQFKEVETKGLKIAEVIKSLEEKISTFPEDIAKRLEELKHKKLKLKEIIENRRRLEVEATKSKEEEARIVRESLEAESQEEEILKTLKKLELELTPLQTSLKLQEILMAVKTCLSHTESREKGECPVCAQSLNEDRWEELKTISEANDFDSMREKVRELEAKKISLSEEHKLLRLQKKKLDLSLNEIRERFRANSEELKKPIESEEALEEEFAKLQKDSWEKEKCLSELGTQNKEREEFRKKYRELRDLLSEHEKKQVQNNRDHQEVEDLWKSRFDKALSPDEIEKIRLCATEIPKYLSLHQKSESLSQELKLLGQHILELSDSTEKKKLDQRTETQKSQELRETLRKEVGEARVSELLEKIRTETQKAQENFDTHEQALKAAQIRLKDLEGRIISYEEQMKAAETMFAAQMNKVREESKQREHFSEAERDFLSKLSTTTLSLGDVPELFSPVADRLLILEAELKTETNDLRARISSLETLKIETEKRLDRMKLLQLKSNDLTDRLGRLTRLSEVLGRDELRSFVLSMVEENLIRQTNLELGRLCQGRYEIIHQNRGRGLTPEFYILDKFREGQTRKVSTLSGGETFMVSLAMALGLAEMTRGQAEIDSLFIDEGFGTLDEESLEDVMEMLNQIQTRGLLVGVISHVKALTRSMPVNLNLSKKSDGTSTIGLRIN